MSENYFAVALKVKFDKDVHIVGVNEEGVRFSDGSLLFHQHDQDCCEQVYANWIDWANDFKGFIEIRGFQVLMVENAGLRLEFTKGYGYDRDHVMFVPCYNAQNGYYSDHLDVAFKSGTDSYVVSEVTGVTFDID